MRLEPQAVLVSFGANDDHDYMTGIPLDGIHYAGAGGDLIARQVLDRLEQAFDLTSWRRAPAPAPQQPPPSQAQGRS